VTKGGSITRTKHFCGRINLGREMVEEDRVKVVYLKGAEMIAYVFSKPYDPSEHKVIARLIHGEKE
jgi:hypothetical protein